MTLLTAESVSKRFPDSLILEKVSFALTDRDRIALVGPNGTGKTTLLELLAGLGEVDAGSIVRSRECIIDYVQQEKTAFLDLSLYDYVAEARQDLLDMHDRIEKLQHSLEGHPDDSRTLANLGDLQQRFEREGGFELENKVKTILTGLGFEQERFGEPLANFSGGEKNRAGLGRALAGKGNLLLLDEPTNHLDMESTRWLEEYLLTAPRACVVVSHDRAFLAVVAGRVWELSDGRIENYTGGFEHYLKEREERRRLAAHRYKHQQEEIARVEEFIRRNMAGQKTKQAQSRQKSLARIKRLPPPKKDSSRNKIDVKSTGRSGALVLRVSELVLGYDGLAVIKESDFELYRGDKAGLVGRNGSGKSTLIKAILGELSPVGGSIELGYNVEVAYFDQNLSDLPTAGTVLDALWEVAPSADANRTRSFLARFGYSGVDVFKSVSSLSGGEKTKLCLARMLYHPANLIILDEPTNHLDIDAREALEEGLIGYDGTLLVVSHDRAFLEKVTNKTLLLRDGRTKLYDGSYSQTEFSGQQSGAVSSKPNAQPSKQSYLAFKEQSRRRSRLKKKIETTRSEIAKSERKLLELEESLHGGIPANDWERLSEVAQMKSDTEQKILELYVELEQLTKEAGDDS